MTTTRKAPPGGKNHNKKPIQAQNAFPASRRISSKRGGILRRIPYQTYFTRPPAGCQGKVGKKFQKPANWCLSVFAVIASQCAHWRGNPPDEWNQVTITTKNRSDSHSSGHYSVHFSSNRGIATPACALVRNDSFFMTMTGNLGRIPANTNLSVC